MAPPLCKITIIVETEDAILFTEISEAREPKLEAYYEDGNDDLFRELFRPKAQIEEMTFTFKPEKNRDGVQMTQTVHQK